MGIPKYAAGSSAALRRVYVELDALFGQLRENPALGQAHDDVRAGLHSFPVGAYIVWYRMRANDLEIVRILHASMDPKSRR